MASAFCPECDAQINVGKTPSEGQFIVCPRCRAELEIVGLDPVELDWVLEDEEYYDDEFEDDDDDYDDEDDDEDD